MAKCRQCGRFMADEYDVHVKSFRDYKNHDICFDCGYWNEKVDFMKNHPDTMIPFVANHQYYVADIDPEHEDHFFKGFGGAKIEVTFFDSGKTVVYDNVWNGSNVPERFWKKLPDIASMRWL